MELMASIDTRQSIISSMPACTYNSNKLVIQKYYYSTSLPSCWKQGAIEVSMHTHMCYSFTQCSSGFSIEHV
jgi:hypothetical protein